MSEFLNFEPIVQETYTSVLKYFKNNLIDILGQDPWLERLWFLHFAALILALLSHAGGITERIGEGADIVQLSSDLSVVLILWQVSCLHIQLYSNRKLIKQLILKISSEWRSDEQLRPEIAAIKRESVESIYLWISRFHKVLTYFIHAYFNLPLIYEAFKYFILQDDAPLSTPFRLKMPFQYKDNFFLFLIANFMDYGILYNTGFLVTNDILLLNTSMCHLRVLFIILKDDIESVAHLKDNSIVRINAVKRLKELIPKHDVLLQLMDELSKAFGAIFLIHLAFFSGTVVFFVIAARVHFNLESAKNLLASSFILTCIYSCCSYGQELTDASLDIAKAAYEGPWRAMSHEYRIYTLFIMLRSQKPYYIKSTSFTNISLQSFTKILNVTWSFLSLIDKVYKD